MSRRLYGFLSPAKSIGRLKAFHGQFGMFVRAYTYIAMHGAETGCARLLNTPC